ncbi:MAG: hypothetical protein QM398_07080 [Thermoproteota archaeon]|nr:hypothetical protein [Thermoproteota archaeon]
MESLVSFPYFGFAAYTGYVSSGWRGKPTPQFLAEEQSAGVSR